MIDMPEPQHARPRRMPPLAVMGPVTPIPVADPAPRRRWWHRRRPAGSVSLPLLLVLLGLGIAGAAFFILFITVYDLLYPVMGWHAVFVPVSGEIVFAYLFITGVYLAIRKLPSGILRPLMMGTLMAGSVVLQVWAARHSVPDATGHLVVVAGFFGIMLVGKSTILSVLGGKVKPDRIGIGQWLAHPVHSARLWRWQQTWGESSRKAADTRYRVLLYAITVAQADERIGRTPFRWRRELPPTLRYELSMGALDCEIDAAQPGWQETVRGHVGAHLAMLPPLQSGDTPGDTTERSSGDTDERSGRDSDRRSDSDTGERKPGDTDRSAWPETKAIDPQVLARMVRTAIGRWDRSHDDGRKLPALQLESLIRVRMSRRTAASLLADGYAAIGQRKAGAR